MPDMSDLQEYISGLTGKEVDAAILMLMSRYLATFNGRSGPNIQPQLGDYDADKIGKGNIAVPESLEEIITGQNTAQILTNILDCMVSIRSDIEMLKKSYVEEFLWVGPSSPAAQGNGTLFDLTKSVFEFDYIRFYYCHGVSCWGINEIQDYNVEFTMRKALGATTTLNGGFYLWQYDTRYKAFVLTTEKQFKQIEVNDANYTVIRYISGIKYKNYDIINKP